MSQQPDTYLIDGYTMNPSYLIEGCIKPHPLYIHHTCIESLPQLSKQTNDDVIGKFSSVLPLDFKPLTPFRTRAIMLLKLNSLARGITAVRPDVMNLLKSLYERDILPIIPETTAYTSTSNTHHVAAIGRVLYGGGQVLYNGRVCQTAEFFQQNNIKALEPYFPEWATFYEGNEFNTHTMVLAYDRIWTAFNSLTLTVFLAFIAKGYLKQPILLSRVKQFTSKGPSKIMFLVSDYLNYMGISEDSIFQTNGDTPVQLADENTTTVIFDFICSFGRVLDVLLNVKEFVKTDINTVRDSYIVSHSHDKFFTSQVCWGNGSYSGIVTRQIDDVAKELILLTNRYQSLVNCSLPEHKYYKVKCHSKSVYEKSTLKVQNRIELAFYNISLFLKSLFGTDCSIVLQSYLKDFYLDLTKLDQSDLATALKHKGMNELMKKHRIRLN
ncbi:Histidine ammonia-lyase [Entamoeba marina]